MNEVKRPTPVEACMGWARWIELRILNEFEHSQERDNVDDAIAALREALRTLDAAK